MQKSDPSIQADLRHLVLRGETASATLKLRAGLLSAFRTTLTSHDLTEVTPPCLVQTQVEGGATLFKLEYTGSPRSSRRARSCTSRRVSPRSGTCFVSRRASARRIVIRVAIWLSFRI